MNANDPAHARIKERAENMEELCLSLRGYVNALKILCAPGSRAAQEIAGMSVVIASLRGDVATIKSEFHAPFEKPLGTAAESLELHPAHQGPLLPSAKEWEDGELYKPRVDVQMLRAGDHSLDEEEDRR